MMDKKKAKKMANHPVIKKQTEKFANEIAQLLTQQFEIAKNRAEETGGEFKLDMNEEIKRVLEEKGKEMSSFVKTMVEDQKKNQLNKMNNRNHAIKVSIR